MQALMTLLAIWYTFQLLIYIYFVNDPQQEDRADVLSAMFESMTMFQKALVAVVDPSSWFIYRHFKDREK